MYGYRASRSSGFATGFALSLGQLLAVVSLSILLATSASAQQAGPPTSDQPVDKPVPKDHPNPDEKANQLKPITRSAAFASTGDSATGSISGIQIPETTKVNSGGAATQSFPIVVPPGTAGVQPKLAFQYNSQGENSLLGVGWSVSGLPVVHRCPRTVAQDGFKGGINYDTNDRFCLDGTRLMNIGGSEYRTEVDSFVKVVSYGSAGSGPAYFKVLPKPAR